MGAMPAPLTGTAILILLLTGCAPSPPAVDSTAGVTGAHPGCRAALDASVVLWSCRIEPGAAPAIHELSGIHYDQATGTLWAVSDESNTGTEGAAAQLRAFTLSGSAIEPREARLLRRVSTKAAGSPLPWQIEALAPELADGRWTGAVFVGSERDTWSPTLRSQIYRCDTAGTCRVAFSLPPEFHSPADGTAPVGIVDNQGIEGVTVSPSGARLFAALERPLHQETPAAGRRARVRLLEFAPDRATVLRQYAYELDPRPLEVVTESGAPGISEILAASNAELLVLERSYSASCGNTIRVFQVTLDQTRALEPAQAIATASPLRKRLLVDLTDEKAAFDDAKLSGGLENFEGMTFGPALADRSRTLMLVSDDNARDDQITAVIALRMDSLPSPAARRWRDGDAPLCPKGR